MTLTRRAISLKHGFVSNIKLVKTNDPEYVTTLV